MPNYKGHLAGGFVTFLGTAKVMSLYSPDIANNLSNNWPLYISFCLLGSLFPDIDTKSKIQRYFYFFILVVIIYLISSKEWLTLSILAPISLLPLLVHHRGIFHKFWFLLLISISVLILVQTHSNYNMKHAAIACFFFIAGWISHIILDYGFWRFFRKKVLKRRF